MAARTGDRPSRREHQIDEALERLRRHMLLTPYGEAQLTWAANGRVQLDLTERLLWTGADDRP